jgi:hypothetical protein
MAPPSWDEARCINLNRPGECRNRCAPSVITKGILMGLSDHQMPD